MSIKVSSAAKKNLKTGGESPADMVRKIREQIKNNDYGAKKNKLLNLSEDIGYKSYASRAVPSVDIPDPQNLTLEFVYNYFTPDERVRKSIDKDDQIINMESSTDNEVLYQITNDKRPRFIRINFKPAKNLQNDNSLRLEGATILNNLDKIKVEGATSSKYFSGVELVDTLSDKNFYNFAKMSTFVQNVDEDDSPNSNAQRLADIIQEDELRGDNKKLIMDAMSDLQPSGYSYAKSDVRREQVEAAYDSAARQSFSLKFNNLFINDIMTSANRRSSSVFEDEIRAFTVNPSISEDLQKQGRSKVNPSKIFEDEYEFYGTPIQDNKARTPRLKRTLNPKNIDTTPKFSVVGYIVQRFEVLANGSLEVLEPLIIENPDATNAIDFNVRYGGTYIYKIRTISAVETVAKKIKLSSFGVITQYVRSKFLLASEGISGTIECVERTPPPPPVNVRFRYDYNYRKPVISWEFPINPTRDIARFQVLKRINLEEPFELLVEYDFDSSFIKSDPLENGPGKNIIVTKFPVISHTDQKFKEGDSPIYAIAAVDAHGMTSNYSEQFQINYDKFKNVINKKLISRAGAPKPYPNMFLESDTFQDLIKTSGKDRMTVVFDPEYYVVTKTRQTLSFGSFEEDLKLIAVDPGNPTYKIQIINTDLQQSEVVDISIGDLVSPPLAIPAAKISKNNLSFEFGVKVD